MSTLDTGAIALGRVTRGGLAWAAVAVLAAKRRGDASLAVRTMGAAWTADLLAVGLSYAIGRERPCRRHRAQIDCPDSPSFPSNHAATAAAAASLLAGELPGPLLAAAVLAVMASRVRVGVHHVGDVVGGAALGLAVARIFEPNP